MALNADTHWGDKSAHAACEAYARVTTSAIVDAGQALYFFPPSDTVKGLAVVTRMGGSLASGTSTLLNASNAYGAAAVLRQFVEVEYLWWTFADDPEDAARWLRASRSQLARHFKPAQMRKRSGGRFRAQEYQAHCDRGGHPNPAGAPLVYDKAEPDPLRVLSLDLCQHLERGWRLLTTACAAVNRSTAVQRDAAAVEAARLRWYACDPCAARMP